MREPCPPVKLIEALRFRLSGKLRIERTMREARYRSEARVTSASFLRLTASSCEASNDIRCCVVITRRRDQRRDVATRLVRYPG